MSSIAGRLNNTVMGMASISAATIFLAAAAMAYKRFVNNRDNKPVVVISLPDWLYQYQKEIQNRTFITDEDMMDVAIQISAMNVQYNTGGPFGTAIFSRAKLNGNKIALVACGCNRVVPLQNSVLHGETTAIQFAEHVLQTHSLAATDTHEYILCTSCEPCCMCLGSILWSKVSELHCSGTKADAEAIGFDEGPVFPESYKSLEAAGIKVKFQISLKESQQVLQKYGETGIIY